MIANHIERNIQKTFRNSKINKNNLIIKKNISTKSDLSNNCSFIPSLLIQTQFINKSHSRGSYWACDR